MNEIERNESYNNKNEINLKTKGKEYQKKFTYAVHTSLLKRYNGNKQQ